jgi:hypothetical protein
MPKPVPTKNGHAIGVRTRAELPTHVLREPMYVAGAYCACEVKRRCRVQGQGFRARVRVRVRRGAMPLNGYYLR